MQCVVISLPVCRVEEERQADLERRDALAERLKQKDLEKQRKIVERSDKKVRKGGEGGEFVVMAVCNLFSPNLSLRAGL